MSIDSTLRWINFRATTSYVTDGSNQTPLTGDTGVTYPTAITIGGSSVNVGLEVADSDNLRDRDSTFDPRLAGIFKQTNNGTQSVLRIDLPAADEYELYLGLGDGAERAYVEIADNTTKFHTIDFTSADGVELGDASGSPRATPAAFAINNYFVRRTFSSSILRIYFGTTTADAGSTGIRCVGIRRCGTSSGLFRVGSRRTKVATAAQSWTVKLPYGVQDNDLLEFIFVTNTNANSQPGNFPSGVTQIGSDIDITTDSTMMVCYKKAASEGSSITFTNLWDATENGSCVVTAYRGQNTNSPITGVPSGTSATAVTSVSGPSVTPTVDGAMIRQIVGTDPSATTYTGTPDSSPAATKTSDDPETGAITYIFAQEYLQMNQAPISLDVTGLTSDDYGYLQYAIAPASGAGSGSVQSQDHRAQTFMSMSFRR